MHRASTTLRLTHHSPRRQSAEVAIASRAAPGRSSQTRYDQLKSTSESLYRLLGWLERLKSACLDAVFPLRADLQIINVMGKDAPKAAIGLRYEISEVVDPGRR